MKSLLLVATLIGTAGANQPASRFTIFDPVNFYFASGSSRLDQNTRTRLDGLARLALRESRFQLLLMGHADSVGTQGRNLLLSCRRARAVRDHMAAYGIPSERIIVEGHGEARPMIDRGAETDEPDNRRVALLFVDEDLLAEWRRRAGRGRAC